MQHFAVAGMADAKMVGLTVEAHAHQEMTHAVHAHHAETVKLDPAVRASRGAMATTVVPVVTVAIVDREWEGMATVAPAGTVTIAARVVVAPVAEVAGMTARVVTARSQSGRYRLSVALRTSALRTTAKTTPLKSK